MSREIAGELPSVNSDAIMAARIGLITIEQMPTPEADPITTQHALYCFEALVRAFAEHNSVVDVRAISDLLADGMEVPEADIQVLCNEVRLLAHSCDDIRDIGDGLFTILPVLHARPGSKRSTSENPGKSDTDVSDKMTNKEFESPRRNLPRSKRARQDALSRSAKARKSV